MFTLQSIFVMDHFFELQKGFPGTAELVVKVAANLQRIFNMVFSFIELIIEQTEESAILVIYFRTLQCFSVDPVDHK